MLDPTTELTSIAERARSATGRYAEFLRAPAMSAGVYVLASGATDRQTPHAEDEIYFVTAGRGRLTLSEKDLAVGPGQVIFVPARAPHRFHSIEEELVLLVVFAPSEGALSGSQGRAK